MNGDQARVIRVKAYSFAVVKRSQMLRLFATREQAEAYAKRA